MIESNYRGFKISVAQILYLHRIVFEIALHDLIIQSMSYENIYQLIAMHLTKN